MAAWWKAESPTFGSLNSGKSANKLRVDFYDAEAFMGVFCGKDSRRA
jgi:hypothetical protein